MRRWVVLIAALLLVTPAVAKAPPVTVGKVSVARGDLKRELEQALSSEIAKLDLSAARQQFVLTASLVKLETTASARRVESTCIVSAELAQKKGGSLRAVFRGKARAEDASGSRRSTELAALHAAVRSAVKRLPDAVR